MLTVQKMADVIIEHLINHGKENEKYRVAFEGTGAGETLYAEYDETDEIPVLSVFNDEYEESDMPSYDCFQDWGPGDKEPDPDDLHRYELFYHVYVAIAEYNGVPQDEIGEFPLA